MPTPLPVWKRIAGGFFGIAVLVGAFLLLKGQDTSGEDNIQKGQERIALGAAVTFAGILLIRHRTK